MAAIKSPPGTRSENGHRLYIISNSLSEKRKAGQAKFEKIIVELVAWTWVAFILFLLVQFIIL